MKNKNDMYVEMEHVIGELAHDYNIPLLRFDNLVLLGQRAVAVYGLSKHAKSIPFADLCEYIVAFVNTPFGAKQLQELAKDK